MTDSDVSGRAPSARTSSFVTFAMEHPQVVLAVAAALEVVLEAIHVQTAKDTWVALPPLVFAAALLLVWRGQDALRFWPALAIITAFHAAIMLVHLHFGMDGDVDARRIYASEGHAFVTGHYPHSEYPPGAVTLFGAEWWLSGGAERVANALAMVAVGAAAIAVVWRVRPRMTAWLAVVVGLSPSLAFVWEFKFDALPALLLVGGALLAYRERWVTAGAVLAVGAWTKWTPGLAVVALAAWLLASGRGRDAARHAGAFAATFVLLYVPFVAWDRTATFAAYHRQAGRAITAESMWYLLLRPAGLAHLGGHASLPAGAPHWATVTATGIQALLLVALVAIAARARSRAGAVAVAVLLPAVFLLTNRIFSPQFMLVAAPAFAVAGGLVLATRRAQLVLGVLIGVAAAANAIVYPYALPEYATYWVFASAVLFVSALGTCAWLVARARIVGEEQLAARTA